MKYFAIVSVCIYFTTIYFLKKEPKISNENLKKDVITKILPKVKTLDKKIEIKKQKLVVLPKIEKKLNDKIIANFPKTLETKITPLEEVTVLKQGYEISAVKVLVSLKNSKGQKTSYNALINKKTGQILQTFNRPHLEFQEKTGLRYKEKI